MDFRRLGYHNPRVERPRIHEEEGQEDPKAELWRGLEPTTVEHSHSDPRHQHPTAINHIAGPDAANELTKLLPHVEKPRPVLDPDQEPFDPVVHGFLSQYPGVVHAQPVVPKEAGVGEGPARRPPLAQRMARSLINSPTMRNQVVDVPDEALILDPSEVREEPMDEQVAAPMDDVDPYTDTRQFKTAI